MSASVVSAPLFAGCDRKKLFSRTPARIASAPGVTADTITLGSIYPLSGPASGYAPIVQTMDAYFKRLNDGDGINGRTIRFLVEDDGYRAANTSAAARKLIEDDRVFALAGDLGTATTAAIIEYLKAEKVPLLFAVSGSEALTDGEQNPWIMGLQVSYPSEARILGRYISETWPDKTVGALYQNDDFGNGFLAYKQTLGSGNAVAGSESYDAPARDLSRQIRNLQAKGAEVLVIAATSEAAGRALKTAADLAWKPNILLSSAAADGSLFGRAGGAVNVEGVISTAWERSYDDPGPELQPLKDLLAAYATEVSPTQGCVTGYIIATLTAETLRRAGTNPTRASLMAAAESFRKFDVPQLPFGSTVSTSKTDHSPIKSLQLTRAVNGRFVPFGGVMS